MRMWGKNRHANVTLEPQEDDPIFEDWDSQSQVRDEPPGIPWGFIPTYPLAIPHCEFREDAVGASSPYLGEMMTDERIISVYINVLVRLCFRGTSLNGP